MYKHILFAVEFSHETCSAAQKVQQLRDIFQAKLSLIHVVEVPAIYSIFDDPLYIEKSCVAFAKKDLAELAEKLNVAPENQYLETGDPRVIIPEFMGQISVDFLIIGHHKRHGIYHILGSTAQTILSNANCDVLTIPYSSYSIK